MDNIHAPTVPSGPTTAPVTNGSTAQLSFTDLQQKKNDLEEELKALGSVLDSVRPLRPSNYMVSINMGSARREYGYAFGNKGWVSKIRYRCCPRYSFNSILSFAVTNATQFARREPGLSGCGTITKI